MQSIQSLLLTSLVPKQWDSNWSWFYHEPAAVHMFSENATEGFPAHGTFNFDQGYPSP